METEEIIWLSGLTSSEKIFLLYLCQADRDHWHLSVSLVHISAATGLDRKTVLRVIAGLEEQGIVSVERPGIGLPNSYRVNSTQIPIRSKPEKSEVKKLREQFNRQRARILREMLDRGYPYVCNHPSCQHKKELHIDHVVPLARGGDNSIENLQFLCLDHNSEKGVDVLS